MKATHIKNANSQDAYSTDWAALSLDYGHGKNAFTGTPQRKEPAPSASALASRRHKEKKAAIAAATRVNHDGLMAGRGWRGVRGR